MIKFYQASLLLFFILPAQGVWADHGHQEKTVAPDKPAQTATPEKPSESDVPEKTGQEQLFSIGINVIPKEQ